jgi:hypothetical protein
LRAAGRRSIAGSGGNDGTGNSRVEPDLSGIDFSDRLYQAVRGTVFEKDSGRAVLQGAQHHRVTHSGGHHQNTADEAMTARMIEKVRPLFVAKIVVQQNNVDLFKLGQRQSLTSGGIGGNNLQVSLGL